MALLCQMPPKKSNLNNASSKGSRRKCVERAQQLLEQIETRNAAQRIRTAESRAQESQEQRDERLQQNITRKRAARERNIATALKFRNEAAGMCCASGKVVLSPLPVPPEPLLSLLTGNSDDSKLFLRQVYHKIGSLMPMPDNNPKFLQIYFMGDCEERVTTRCLYNFIEQAEERAIVILLENFFEDHNQLIQLIKRVSPRLQNDNYQIVIKADKVPLGEHAGRFNAPTVDEVAVIMVGDPVDKRSIKITRRDNTVSTISDLHRSYDALQYPLIFWQGQDEYHLNIKQYDPNTGDYRNNKVSSMNYYAHRIMVRQHQDNYILRYRQLFHQYIVDMYAKVESERLRFLRFNQTKLRSEEYIHLRDAVAGNIDGNLNPNDIGNAFILPSSYIGSPRNMQEYIQDAMTYDNKPFIVMI
nr:uncharacterized protein LOC124224788 [Neodiprion pinetum]